MHTTRHSLLAPESFDFTNTEYFLTDSPLPPQNISKYKLLSQAYIPRTFFPGLPIVRFELSMAD